MHGVAQRKEHSLLMQHARGILVVANQGHSRIRKDTPALPFCHLKLKAEKPKDPAYPEQVITLGDRLRAKRLDLGLLQKDVAVMIGVTEDSVCYWENNRVRPARKRTLKLKDFLNE